MFWMKCYACRFLNGVTKCRSQNPTHRLPVAQDFYSVFNIGTDDKHIAPIDEGGLAFTAAIRGWIKNLKNSAAENAELKQRLEKRWKKIILHQKSN